jgi:acyl-coenzyme A synthetase/AMP-(fatty) acid ligase
MELQDYVQQTIAPDKYPHSIGFFSALPCTETGKPQRFKLWQQQHDGSSQCSLRIG